MPRLKHTVALDDAVLNVIKGHGPIDSFSLRWSDLVRRACTKHNISNSELAVDRALQRLRTANKIRYQGGKGRLWTVV